MWFPLVEFMEYMEGIKLLLQKTDLNESINRISAITLFFLIAYLLYYKIVKALLIRARRIPVRFHQELIRKTFDIIFYFCCLSFLILYHSYFIYPQLYRYPKRASLFLQNSCESQLVSFKIISFILVSFNIFGSLIDLNCCDLFSEAISKLLYATLLLTCYVNAFENYSIVLSINLTCFNMFSHLLSLLAIYFHSEKETVKFRTLASFKIVCWIYMFLNFLPFQYMLPTLYDKNIPLIISFMSWYGSQVITSSPILDAISHRLYHFAKCPGGLLLSRCLLMRDSFEWRHHNRLTRALLETKLHHQRHQINKLNLSESAASAKTFQTLKCVMTLKRKLKRIRENQKQ